MFKVCPQISKLFIVCSILISAGQFSCAQLAPTWGVQQTAIGFSPSYMYAGRTGMDFSISLSDFQSGCVGYALKYASIAGELFPAVGELSPVWGAKAGIGLMAFGLTMRLSQLTWMSQGMTDVRLLPEIGFDAFTVGNICYGYSGHIAGNRIASISPHRFTLTLNLRKVIKEDDPRFLQADKLPVR